MDTIDTEALAKYRSEFFKAELILEDKKKQLIDYIKLLYGAKKIDEAKYAQFKELYSFE